LVDKKAIEGVVDCRFTESIVTVQLVPLGSPASTKVTVYSPGGMASNVTLTV